MPSSDKQTANGIVSNSSCSVRDAVASRRRFLTGTAGILAGVGALTGSASASEACPVSGFRYMIQPGTQHQTSVHVIEAEEPGPTAVVVGGIHGDEAAGYEAGRNIVDWQLKRGTLVVIPEADVDAIERGTRHGAVGHLNRQFPVGEEPMSDLASDIWNVITSHDADVVLDLHSSRGIWDADTDFDGYGQAIFAAPSGDAAAPAERTAATMNDRFLEDRSDDYDFIVGATIDGSRPLLAHKVVGDLGRPGYITEVTEDDTDLASQIEWTESMVSLLLREFGMETDYASRQF